MRTYTDAPSPPFSFVWHPIVVVRDRFANGDPVYTAHFEDHPGCRTQGDTPAEAIAGLRDIWPRYQEAIAEIVMRPPGVEPGT